MSTLNVLTLIAADKDGLSEALVSSLAARLESAQQDWLAPGRACDIFFSGEAGDIAALLKHKRIDHAVQPAEGRKKKLFIADMDSTMITVECIDELADFAGVKSRVAAITERAMRGEINFEAALTERVALLKGLPESILQHTYEQRVRFSPGAKELLATMKKHGAHCVLVSGGFTFFTSRVRAALGFHEDHSNQLEIENGKLTGRVLPPILGKEAKLATLEATCRTLGISPQEVLAVGDGANDAPMVEAAGMGIAYHAKPVLREAANVRIDRCDLTALLYVQGYKEEGIIK